MEFVGDQLAVLFVEFDRFAELTPFVT